MTETINQKLARLLAENPGLPIKVQVNDEMWYDDDGRCIGELNGCEVTEYVNYGSDAWFYFGRDNEDLLDRMRDDIWRQRRREIFKNLVHINNWFKRDKQAAEMTNEALPGEKLDSMAREAINELDWKPCVLLTVEP